MLRGLPQIDRDTGEDKGGTNKQIFTMNGLVEQQFLLMFHLPSRTAPRKAAGEVSQRKQEDMITQLSCYPFSFNELDGPKRLKDMCELGFPNCLAELCRVCRPLRCREGQGDLQMSREISETAMSSA